MTTTTFSRLDRHVTETPPALTPDGAGSRELWIDRFRKHAAHNARNAATAAGYDWRLPLGTIDDLVSVVDALVSNALVHAKWTDEWLGVSLVIERIGHRLVVEVRDPDPTLPQWPTAQPMDIAALLNDPDIAPDDPKLTHKMGLVDVAGRTDALSAFREEIGKCVRAEFTIGGAR